MNVKFLIPLGLLGLLGIVALILIYIIKPNFQQKLISSTFIWRLSLKFKKANTAEQTAQHSADCVSGADYYRHCGDSR
ncbi:MAG: BatA domain-containing protein [Oscillospiraceae bacterium]|nr:MAG: BatA domain-containing protein [Oscillospiraceae bacterium]